MSFFNRRKSAGETGQVQLLDASRRQISAATMFPVALVKPPVSSAAQSMLDIEEQAMQPPAEMSHARPGATRK